MKKLINDPRAVVPEMLEGLVALDPNLALLAGESVVLRRDAGDLRAGGKVALISGGGAGHEPAHAGYVGAGLLTAAVSGDVFTSPSTDAVLAAIRAVGGPSGVLLIVKNYTGDRLNFGLAAEIARAEGIPTEMVIVDDDVALAREGGHAGRRGIAGTVFVHKVAGAAAEAGLALAEVKKEAEAAIAALGTMGVALSPCTVPAAGRAGFELAEDEIELGLGIHGEAGVRREKIAPVDALAKELLDRILEDRGIVAGGRVALLVNGLGGTPAMELAIVTRAALAHLAAREIRVEHAWSGSFLTALEMAGCSLSLLSLDEGRLARLRAPAASLAWMAGSARPKLDRPPLPHPTAHLEPARRDGATDAPLHDVLRAVAAALAEAEPHLTALDQAVGDGDLGLSLKRGAETILRDLAQYDARDPAAALRLLAQGLGRALGGTSGPLYAAFLVRAAATVGTGAQAKDWARAFKAGCDAVAHLGGAARGERTMLDALYPAAEALEAKLVAGVQPAEALAAAVEAAKDGARATAAMPPRRGRTSYLGERAVGHPDPGAEAVAIWLEAIRRTASK